VKGFSRQRRIIAIIEGSDVTCPVNNLLNLDEPDKEGALSTNNVIRSKAYGINEITQSPNASLKRKMFRRKVLKYYVIPIHVGAGNFVKY